MRRICSMLWWLCLAIASGVGSAATHPVTPPPLPSPIAFFRQLLNTNSEGRSAALQHHSEARREVLRAKLLEYEALPPSEREQRLRATEFRYYLRPLLATPAVRRSAQLASVPSEYREPIADRLARWDALPESAREDLLAYDQAITWLARFNLSNRASTTPAPPLPPPMAGTHLEFELARWQALPESHRDLLCRQFEQFLEMPNPKRERTLGELSPEERQHMEETLSAFARLPPSQRQVCISSFRKLAQMSLTDRADFLRSADRWREMSPDDRARWRQIVDQLPPLPPGFTLLPPPPPRPAPTSAEQLSNSTNK
jgi:hypothetical protein